MVRRRKDRHAAPSKLLQSFFCFSAKNSQPICMTIGSPSRTVAQATPELMRLVESVMPERAAGVRPLVLADAEHYISSLMKWSSESRFDLLVPMPNSPSVRSAIEGIGDAGFKRRWAGYATASASYQLGRAGESYPMIVQRKGEGDFETSAFICTNDRDHLEALAEGYPMRWDCEEFYRHYQEMGWSKAGTMNQNIRYAQMSLALVAQASAYMLRGRLPESYRGWNARHFADSFLGALDGDVRVERDTIIVTYYNAPERERLAESFGQQPQKLEAEGVDPRIPWLFNLKLDFRFR